MFEITQVPLEIRSNEEGIATTAESISPKGIYQEEALQHKIAKLTSMLKVCLPLVNKAFKASDYFDLDMNNYKEDQEFVIRMIKNLYYGLLQQQKEIPIPLYDEGLLPCRNEIICRSFSNNKRTVGIALCKGRRREMEDRHLAAFFVLRWKNRMVKVEVYAVFDGHGGDKAAKFGKNHLIEYLKSALEEHNPQQLTQKGIFAALKDCCIKVDEAFFKTHDLENPDFSGTTATISVIMNSIVYVCNVGDSRTFLVKGDKAYQLTEDAKPANSRYKKLINQLGGKVLFISEDWRIDGRVNIARTFGDHFDCEGNRTKGFSSKPKISLFPLKAILPEENQDAYLVHTSDGAFEAVNTTNSIGELIAPLVKGKETSLEIAYKIVKQTIEIGSRDNITAVVVSLFKQSPEIGQPLQRPPGQKIINFRHPSI